MLTSTEHKLVEKKTTKTQSEYKGLEFIRNHRFLSLMLLRTPPQITFDTFACATSNGEAAQKMLWQLLAFGRPNEQTGLFLHEEGFNNTPTFASHVPLLNATF